MRVRVKWGEGELCVCLSVCLQVPEGKLARENECVTCEGRER